MISIELYTFGKTSLIFQGTDNPEHWPTTYLAITNHSEFHSLQQSCGFGEQIVIDPAQIHYNKLETHYDYYFGAIVLPKDDFSHDEDSFSFFIKPGRIIFIDHKQIVSNILHQMTEENYWHEASMERFIYSFFDELTGDDTEVLETLEKKVAQMEEDIGHGKNGKFNHDMIRIRKRLLVLQNFYTQIIEISHGLASNENQCFHQDRLFLFRLFAERAERLRGNVQFIRDYSSEVREIYQSTLDLKQNNIITVLTIVTAVFTPPILIAGWYGMNFTTMPEITWEYGYLYVIVLSIAITYIFYRELKRRNFL
jgi:magnesium transporter